VGLDLGELVRRQARGLVEQLPANVEFADVVQQRRGADVLDPLILQVQAAGDLRLVDRHAIAVVLGVLVLRDEVLRIINTP